MCTALPSNRIPLSVCYKTNLTNIRPKEIWLLIAGICIRNALLFILYHVFIPFISCLISLTADLFIDLIFCCDGSISSTCLFLLFNILGKHMTGILKTIAHAPNIRKPSHQAPIHLGSDGVISTATSKMKKRYWNVINRECTA